MTWKEKELRRCRYQLNKLAAWLWSQHLVPEEFECKLHEKLSDRPGAEIIRDDILVMGYGENKEANRSHDENLIRPLKQALVKLIYA